MSWISRVGTQAWRRKGGRAGVPSRGDAWWAGGAEFGEGRFGGMKVVWG